MNGFRLFAAALLTLCVMSTAQAADTVKVRGGADFRAVVDRITGEIAGNASATPTTGKTPALYVDFNKPVQCVITTNKELIANERNFHVERNVTCITSVSPIIEPIKHVNETKLQPKARIKTATGIGLTTKGSVTITSWFITKPCVGGRVSTMLKVAVAEKRRE